MGEEENEIPFMDESNMVEGDNAEPEKDEKDEDVSVRNNEESNNDDEGDGDPRSGSKTQECDISFRVEDQGHMVIDMIMMNMKLKNQVAMGRPRSPNKVMLKLKHNKCQWKRV